MYNRKRKIFRNKVLGFKHFESHHGLPEVFRKAMTSGQALNHSILKPICF